MRFNFRMKRQIPIGDPRWIPVIRVNMYLGGRWNAVNIGIALSTRPRIINPLVSAGSTADLSICTRQARKNRSIIEAMVDRGLLANLENMSEGGGEEDLSAGGERVQGRGRRRRRSVSGAVGWLWHLVNGDAFESKSRRDKESGAELHWGREWWKLNSLLDGKKIDSITRMRQGARGLCWNKRNGEK